LADPDNSEKTEKEDKKVLVVIHQRIQKEWRNIPGKFISARQYRLPLTPELPVWVQILYLKEFQRKMLTNQPFGNVSGKMSTHSTWKPNNIGWVHFGKTFLCNDYPC
jgi:hypothetical protein